SPDGRARPGGKSFEKARRGPWESHAGQAAGLLALTLRGSQVSTGEIGRRHRKSIHAAAAQVTTGALARGDRQMQARIGEEGRGADALHVAPAQPHVEELMIVELVQAVDHAAVLPSADELVGGMAGAGEEALG